MNKYKHFICKMVPEDFIVNEILAEITNQNHTAEYSIYSLKKCGYTTFSAIE